MAVTEYDLVHAIDCGIKEFLLNKIREAVADPAPPPMPKSKTVFINGRFFGFTEKE